MEHILNKDQIKHLKKQGLWPGAEAFGGVLPAAGPGSGTPREGWGEAIPVRNNAEDKEGVVRAEAVGVAGKGGLAEGGEGAGEEDEEDAYEEEEEDDMSDLFVNNNRAAMMQLRTDHEDEQDSDDDDEESDS